MKKTLVIFLALILLVGITAFALAENKPGDIVTITFRMANNPGGAWTIQADVDTSNAPVEIVSGSAQVVNWTMAPEGTGKTFGVFSTSGAVSPGTIGSMQFRIKNDAKPGKYIIGMNVVEAADGLGNGVNYPSISGGEIVIACTHEKTSENITKKATCAAKGEKQKKCDICGEVLETKEIPATGHKWDDGKVTTAPTCTEKGVKTFTCQNDKSHTKTEEIPALGHKWDEGKLSPAPTCTETGVRVYTCLNDSTHTKTEEVPALGHAWTEWELSADGTQESRKCTRCDKVETEIYGPDDPNEDDREPEFEPVVDPEICKHDQDTFIGIKTDPTCTEKGEQRIHCALCGLWLRTEEIPPLEHVWGDWEVTKAATINEEGEEARICLRCGEKETRTIAATPCEHEKTTEKIIKEATCTEAGQTQTVCDICHEVIKTEEIPPLGHIAGEWEVLKEATEEEDGLRQLKCTRCGEVLREERLTLHKIDWRYNQTVTAKGIRYRDIKPGLTNKWFMFTPVDLNQNGVQTFDLLVANARRIGSVTVTVQDGKAVVNYRMFKTVDQLDMGFALLPDLDSVTDVEAIDYSRFAFGQEISVQDDLDGDALVLLQVMGHVNYDFEDGRYEQFSSAGKDYADYVNALKALMD